MAGWDKLPGIVTTSLKARGEQLALAARISAQTGLPLVPRGKKAVEELAGEWNAVHVIVVKAGKVACITGQYEFFFHPGMSALRIKEIKSGKNDTMINAMNLQPGQRLLDCTLGLGSDAIVASYVLGKEGVVVGLESSPIVAAIVRHGMQTYRKAAREVLDAMQRVVVQNEDHRRLLEVLPDNRYDVVYFDPMFRLPQMKSSGINAFRPLADHRPLTPEIITQAMRVAARRVVVKDSKRGSVLHKLGFNRFEGGGKRAGDIWHYDQGRLTGDIMNTREKIPLLIIAGPTATGKTAVAVRVAQHLAGEVVSADSMQIYRYMNIGTAKPTVAEMGGVPHHLIDVVDPDADFTVANFQALARQAIQDIHQRGKLPLLVGGTGFYIDAVIYNYDFSAAAANEELRAHYKHLAEQKGNDAVHDELRQVDPETAARIHVNDLKRTIRALEIYYQTGVKGAMFREKNKVAYPGYDILFGGLYYERDKLYKRIEARVDRMVAEGLVREVRGLLDAGYHRGLVSMQGLGYKEIIGFLNNEYSLAEAVHMLKRNTRRFAKRQLTWFKRYSNIKWIDMEKYDTIDSVAGVIEEYVAAQFPNR
ncbi:tRNA (adenosine(37)-N6)-dimethylallyltransferase MiaA [Desulfoscipio geothermicus]|uniref:tRNA dimethylallyltransferase n=1 Tax=Desulfoscipio geothermicus DSM 3669 TaxID=1121426 RepID=A0A1I6DL39_9FIRM|nr:tRNA (adenosine(37)-N6)-dimethylallyltransferase MiaA [Desulfoscipio geothermicus]SFR06097.1 tRNA dimethylallyltransferase [Desulfoscipio geothermicus DSM 3669]